MTKLVRSRKSSCRPLDFGFCQTVNSTCGFIKNENFGISQHRAGDANELPLAAEIPTPSSKTTVSRPISSISLRN